MPGQSGTQSQAHANHQHTRLTRRAGHAIAAWHPTSGEWKALGNEHGDMCSIHHILFSRSCSFSLSQASKVRWSVHVKERYSYPI